MTADRLGTIDLLREIEADLNSAAITSGEVGLRGACIEARNKLREIRLAALTPAAAGVDDELLDAAEAMLRWCVKNVERWHFPQYDDLHRACTNRRAAPAPPPADAVRALVGKVEPRPAKAHTPEAEAFNEGWNACLAAMSALSAAPVVAHALDATAVVTHEPAAAPTPEGDFADLDSANPADIAASLEQAMQAKFCLVSEKLPADVRTVMATAARMLRQPEERPNLADRIVALRDRAARNDEVDAMVERMVAYYRRAPGWSSLNVEAQRGKARDYLMTAFGLQEQNDHDR